jgi:hypothetical protein
MASKLGPAQPLATTWNGAGAWLIFSQSRHVNFSRTVSITFHWRWDRFQRARHVLAKLAQAIAPQHADQVGACTTVLQPLHALIEAHVLAADRLHGDDTNIPILAKGKTIRGTSGAMSATIVPLAVVHPGAVLRLTGPTARTSRPASSRLYPIKLSNLLRRPVQSRFTTIGWTYVVQVALAEDAAKDLHEKFPEGDKAADRIFERLERLLDSVARVLRDACTVEEYRVVKDVENLRQSRRRRIWSSVQVAGENTRAGESVSINQIGLTWGPQRRSRRHARRLFREHLLSPRRVILQSRWVPEWIVLLGPARRPAWWAGKWAAEAARQAKVERNVEEARRLLSFARYWTRLAHLEDWPRDNVA